MSHESFGESHVDADFSILDKMLAGLEKGHYVDVGILGKNAGKTAGKMTLKAGMATVGMIAAIHEFGSIERKIPKRSFIAMPIQTHQAQIQKAVEGRFAGHLKRGNVGAIFTDIGIAAEAQIQDAFDTRGFGTWKPDAEATIAAKGSDAPLIDTGLLRKSVTSKAGVL